MNLLQVEFSCGEPSTSRAYERTDGEAPGITFEILDTPFGVVIKEDGFRYFFPISCAVFNAWALVVEKVHDGVGTCGNVLMSARTFITQVSLGLLT